MEHKIKKRLSRQELGYFLHTVANAVQRSGEIQDAELALLQTDFAKLELKCRPEADGITIKLEFKTDARRETLQEGLRESLPDPSGDYKALKKRMQATFKRLGVTIANNRIPDEPVDPYLSNRSPGNDPLPRPRSAAL